MNLEYKSHTDLRKFNLIFQKTTNPQEVCQFSQHQQNISDVLSNFQEFSLRQHSTTAIESQRASMAYVGEDPLLSSTLRKSANRVADNLNQV